MKVELPKVYNSISSVSDPLGVMQPKVSKEMSTSAIQNERHGECPKCSQPMTFAYIGSGERVFYCTKCRVAAPMPN